MTGPGMVAPTPPPPMPAITPSVSALARSYASYTRSAPAAISATNPLSFQAMFNSRGAGWSAADATYSVPLPDGKVLWLFGDTLINTVGPNGIRPHGGFIRNSAVLQDGTRFTTITGGTRAHPDSFLTPREPGHWYWPGHGITEGDSLFLFMGKVRQTGAGAWGFAAAGSDMVKLSRSTLEVQEVRSLPGGKDMAWGTAVLRDGAHTYIYGMEGGPGPFDRWARVARVRTGDMGGSWEYWDGSAWTANPAKSVRIADGVSNSFSVMKTRTGYAMVSQELFFGTGLYVKTSSSPVGPWSDWKRIDDGPSKHSNQISYNALVHPEFTRDGQVLVSWNMNTNDGIVPTPDQAINYRPVFRSIPERAFE